MFKRTLAPRAQDSSALSRASWMIIVAMLSTSCNPSVASADLAVSVIAGTVSVIAGAGGGSAGAGGGSAGAGGAGDGGGLVARDGIEPAGAADGADGSGGAGAGSAGTAQTAD